jgi:cytochrome P450
MGEAARHQRETSFPIGATASLEELELDPHPLLSRLRESEPVSWLPALGGWLVTRRELALQAMRDSATFTVDDPRFSTGQVVGASMLTLDGAEHGRHRDAFARPFRLNAVRRRFTALVEEETERLIDAIELAGRAELRRSLAGPLPVGSAMYYAANRPAERWSAQGAGSAEAAAAAAGNPPRASSTCSRRR